MRKEIRNDMSTLRGMHEIIYLLYPTETACTNPDCGHDEFTDAGYDITCSVCNGKGYTLTWDAWQVHGRVVMLDDIQIVRGGIAPLVLEMGDAELYISSRSKELMEKIEEVDKGYVYIKEERFRPTEIIYDGVGKADEWRVELKRFHASERATGY
jgi:hypothetical protein